MLKKLSSVLVLVLALGGQQFLASSASAQDSAAAPAPAAEAASSEAAPAADAASSASQEEGSVLADANKKTSEKEGYGLAQLWAGPNGVPDWISRIVLILMALMSAATWYITATKLLHQSSLNGQAKEARLVWDAKTLQEGVNNLKADSAFRAVAEDGIRAVKLHEGKAGDKISLEAWVSMSLQRSVTSLVNDLQSGMAVLATVASSSPFVGLFGTVYGIYHALIAIAASGQASIDKVAGPVGEALIMTAFGLGVAVPAVFFYNWLIRRNKIVSESLNHFASDVHASLIVGVNAGKN